MFYIPFSKKPDGRDYSKLIGVSGPDHPVGHTQTTPLERRDIPPQLATTLEHIVGQLDIITQVRNRFFVVSFVLRNRPQINTLKTQNCTLLSF